MLTIHQLKICLVPDYQLISSSNTSWSQINLKTIIENYCILHPQGGTTIWYNVLEELMNILFYLLEY